MTDSISVTDRAKNALRFCALDPNDPAYSQLILAIGREIAEAEWLAMKGVAAIIRRNASGNIFQNPDPGVVPPGRAGRTPDQC